MEKANSPALTAIVATLALSVVGPACVASVNHHIQVFGLIETSPGNYATDVHDGATHYLWECGLLFDLASGNPSDDIEWYDNTNNCGNTNHKPGSEDYPVHYHIIRTVGTNGWPTSTAGGLPAIKAIECSELWADVCLNKGLRGGETIDRWTGTEWQAAETDFYDEEDSRSESGNANMYYNCYGYVFNQDGLTNFKLWFADGATGVEKMFTEDAGLYEEATHGTDDLNGDIMYMGGSTGHANYIDDALSGCCMNVMKLKFKYRHSQTFTYEYDDPGRYDSNDFYDGDPEYYQRL